MPPSYATRTPATTPTTDPKISATTIIQCGTLSSAVPESSRSVIRGRSSPSSRLCSRVNVGLDPGLAGAGHALAGPGERTVVEDDPSVPVLVGVLGGQA